MKILYISPSPPDSMNRVRTNNIIRAMLALGHTVTLVSFIYGEKDYCKIDQCKTDFDGVLTVNQPKWKSYLYCFIGAVLPVPLRVLYCRSTGMKKTVKRCLDSGDYDLVYIKRLRLAQYANISKKREIPTIIDITDSLTMYYHRIKNKEHGWRRLLAYEEYLKHRIYEPIICKKYTSIVICSEQDKDYLVRINNELQSHIHVMHNSIQTSEWQDTVVNVGHAGARKHLVFFGMMNYAPNIIAVKYLITQVMPRLPEPYKLEIIGPYCPDELLSYNSERIHFSGYVDSIKDALKRQDIFICPIFAGSGVKNKILQACMAGLPIVTTPLGIEGIHSDILKYVFLADDSEKAKAAVIQIDMMDDAELKKRIKGQQDVIISDNDNVNELQKCFRELGLLC